MKLTTQDKKLLVEWGYSETDLSQIEEASSKTTYEMQIGNEPIHKVSRKTAISVLGRSKYLAGLARSAFHATAFQDAGNKTHIYFDSRRLFR